ncbi:MAG: flagellar protein [Lachnospiraceae bacterium]|nr:flagellar protein [Lachnospiraceae bacterium]
MDVRNCKNCGRMFNYLGGPAICPVCKDEIENKFNQVKEYIREHPQASISEISDENEVAVQQINQWVREERLEFAKDSPIAMNCEKCGASIRTGRFCEKCKNNMASEMTNAFAKPIPVPEAPKKSAHESDKMRFKR